SRCGTSMPPENTFGPPEMTRPRAPWPGAASTASRRAVSRPGSRALTGGLASRISWMSPWRSSSIMGSVGRNVGGPTIAHRVLQLRLAAGRHLQVEAGRLGVAGHRRHAAGHQFPLAPARHGLVDAHGGGARLGVAHGVAHGLGHLPAGAVELKAGPLALGIEVEGIAQLQADLFAGGGVAEHGLAEQVAVLADADAAGRQRYAQTLAAVAEAQAGDHRPLAAIAIEAAVDDRLRRRPALAGRADFVAALAGDALGSVEQGQALDAAIGQGAQAGNAVGMRFAGDAGAGSGVIAGLGPRRRRDHGH